MEASVPIAIVGMSCRFAGDVTDPQKLWRLLAEGRSAWSEIPKSRFNLDGVFHPNFEKLNGTNVKGGHFLSEDVGLFDAHFFNLSAETAAALDPQFRLQLESTYEAFESAGITLQDAAGSNTSVYAGSFFRDYHESLIKDPDSLPRFLLMGTGAAMASNRLSHFFDLRGPSMSVDTGCSTTLTALHQGCQSLRTGESDMSVVGGANVMFNPDMFLAMSSMTLISKDGKSYAFDSRANGYGRGEGSATVILKRLDDALRDGNPIRAIIRDTGVNQDGKTETITTPSGEAQENLIRACYKRAGLDPSQTTYFEAHGTGTPTGDPIEVKAIASVFGNSRPTDQPLRIGSVKTNIGHTETASGVAAVIKVVLALEKGQIPPSINFEKPNKKLHLEDWGLKVQSELESWTAKDGVRRASINNFGYGGSNSHAILEDYDSFLATKARVANGANSDANGSVRNGNGLANGHLNGRSNGTTNGNSNGSGNGTINGHRLSISSEPDDGPRSRVFVLSGKDERATQAMVTNLKDYLLSAQPDDANQFLDDLAYTLCHRRSRFPWATTFSGETVEDLVKMIGSGKAKPVKVGAGPRLGFVYTGQGAQWWAMGRELIQAYPVFKAALMDCDTELKKLGTTWNMIEELNRDPATTKVNELDFSTPVCVAVQIALTHLLRSWGIVPTAVTSHSSGEIAAAYAAGALDLPSAMAIVFARGGLASDMNQQLARKGGMVAVGLGVESSQKYLSAVTNGQIVVACENSPSSITVSGDVVGLDQLEAVLKRENIFARRLKVDAAWHSHHMEAVADAYYVSMDKKVRPAQDHLDFIFSSPSTGVRINRAEEIGSPAHWVHSLTGPVKFVDAFRNMCFDESGGGEPTVDMVVEVGPHAALSGPIQDIMSLPEYRGLDIPYASCLIRKQSAVATMHTLVGTLLQKGYPVNLAPVNFPLGIYGLKVLHDLPRYPWNHQTRHWIEPRVNRAHRQRIDTHHDLLGSLVPGTDIKSPSWRHIVRLSDLPWVRDHVVQNNMIYPAAGFIAMAIEGISFQFLQKQGDRRIIGYELRDIDILNALVVPETSCGIEVQLQLRPCNKRDLSTQGWTEFQVQSVTADSKWTDHCKGVILVQYAALDGTARLPGSAEQRLKQPASESDYRVHIKPQDIYRGLQAGGICHGPMFRNMNSIQTRNKQSLVTFSVADSASLMPFLHGHQHVIHPTTLDSIFQAVYTAVPGAGGKPDTPRVPRSMSKLWVAHNISAQAGHSFKAYVDLGHIDAQTMTTSLTVIDASVGPESSAKPVITIDGFVYQSIGNAPTTAIEPWVKDKFATMKWAPDITFVKEAFLKNQLGSDLTPEEARILMDLRQACLIYIYDALTELTAANLQCLEWYHKKFYIWMRLQVELARTNELAPDSSGWAAMTPKQKTELLDRVRADSTNGEMVCKLGPHIASILRGEVTALELMLQKSLLSRYYLDGLKWGRANEKLGEMVRHFAHKMPRAKMIEIGGGTGGATRHILNALGTDRSGDGPSAASYDFTDVSSGFFEAAKEKFQDWRDLMRYKKLDIEQDPAKQGFEEGTYDVVIACQVLHATKSMHNTMSNVRKLLKPGGKLFIMETTQDQLDIQFVFGFLQGWWLSEEEERKFSPSLTVPMWDRVLHRSGFRGVETEVRDCEDDELYSFSVMSSTALGPPPKFDFDISFITPATGIPDNWLDQLSVSIGLLTCTVPITQTLEEAVFDENRVCIFIDDPDAPILGCASSKQFEGLKNMCTRSKGLLWLSRGGAGESENPLASLAPGFLRSVRQEYTGKRLGALDLDPLKSSWSSESVQTVTDVFRRFFDLSGSQQMVDYEFSDRNGVVHIPRYVKDTSRNESVFCEAVSQPTPQLEPFIQPERPLKLTIGTTGLLDTLAFDDDPSATDRLPDDFVEIEPKAFGVNFRDVMTAMGQLKSRVMGYDCSGFITRLGAVASANGHKKGDRVSVLLRGHYGSRARVHWTSAVQIPDSMSFETAASLPTQYVTAYLSLYDTARLQKAETVLIHSATGGVGQAAVMLSQRVGAEIFVTVGSEEKRNFVMSQFGIQPDHIFSSRDTTFAAGILSMTKGRGVDVVLNSLAGGLLQESFNCLAPFGRFVELGKRDFELNHSLAMEAFTRAVSFSSIDLIAFGEQKPLHANRILKDVVRLVEAGEVNAVHPISIYPISDVEKAFRLMQAGKHMGKIVLSVTPDVLVPVLPQVATPKLHSDSSYMVVGGFGGIGRSICRWLAEQGAEHLVVVSRSAKNTEKIRQLRAELENLEQDVNITAIGCDISDAAQLKKELDAYAASGAPAIRGIIHGGMELRDSVLERMTLDEHNVALGPKLHGSWNIHQHFSGSGDLDFYIMLSSLIGIVGFASQSNYSAGGAFQDALAQHRVGRGLPGVSIDLGIVKSVGYLAGSDSEKTIESLQRHGFTELSEADILGAIGSAIGTPFAGQLTLGLNTGPTGHKDDSPLGLDMRFCALKYRESGTDVAVQANRNSAGDLAASIADASTIEQAAAAIVAGIAKKLMDIFMIAEDEVVPSKSPADFGVDSLVAVELRNMLALRAGAELSIFDIMQSPSLTALADTVASKSSHISPSIMSG